MTHLRTNCLFPPLYTHLGSHAPYITPSGIANNGDTYTDNFLAKKLVLYIKNLLEKTRYIFLLEKSRPILKWPKYQISNVPESANPPNTPEIRWIENFWDLIKEEVYKDGWAAENLEQLRSRIFYCFEKVDENCVKNLGESTRRRINTIRRFDLVEIRKYFFSKRA